MENGKSGHGCGQISQLSVQNKLNLSPEKDNANVKKDRRRLKQMEMTIKKTMLHPAMLSSPVFSGTSRSSRINHQE